MASTRPGGELHWICQIHFHVQTNLKRRTQLADCVVRGQIGRCAESDTTNARRRNASRQLFTAITRCPSTSCRHRKHRSCRSSHTVRTHTLHVRFVVEVIGRVFASHGRNTAPTGPVQTVKQDIATRILSFAVDRRGRCRCNSCHSDDTSREGHCEGNHSRFKRWRS